MQLTFRKPRDRGAVAVWVAILLVPFLMVAALAIDIGAVHADRQRLQHGADAAALAIARDCAAGSCGTTSLTAQRFADDHMPIGGNVSALVPVLEDGWVEVTTTGSREHWFAPVLGEDSITQTLSSAASWGSLGEAHSVAWAFHSCELATPITTGDAAARRPAVLQLSATGAVVGLTPSAIGTTVQLDQSKHSATTCSKPYGGNFEPGAFGWLAGDARCEIDTSIGLWIPTANGGSTRGTCEAALSRLVGQRLLVPVFDDSRKIAPNDPEFHIAGYIAVDLVAYDFKATGKDWLRVTIREWVGTDGETSPAAPDLGTNVVNLELPRGEQP